MNDDIHHLPPYPPQCFHKALFCPVTGSAHMTGVVLRKVMAIGEPRGINGWF